MLHILKCCLILAAAGLVSCGGNKQALRPPASFYRVSGQETGEYRLESAAIRVELEHGVLSGTGSNLTYFAYDGYTGNDSFTYVARDAYLDSAPATVTITVEKNPHLDSDGDGVSDIEEYAFGGDPLDPENRGTPPRLEQNLSFIQHIMLLRNDPSLTATIYTSTNLLNESWTEWKVQTGGGGDSEFTLYTNGIPAIQNTFYFKTEIE